MNINKVLYLLNQAKAMGLTDIRMMFDTEGRKFDYCMAEIGSMFLQKDYLDPEMKGAIITLHEDDDKNPRTIDPRLEPGGIWNKDAKERKSGWGFWSKDYTMWYGPWHDFRDAEKAMKMHDELFNYQMKD